MSIKQNSKQNYPLCRLKLLVENKKIIKSFYTMIREHAYQTIKINKIYSSMFPGSLNYVTVVYTKYIFFLDMFAYGLKTTYPFKCIFTKENRINIFIYCTVN